MKLSRSTAHRLNRPAVIALALAALRLRIHLPARRPRQPRVLSGRLELEAEKPVECAS